MGILLKVNDTTFTNTVGTVEFPIIPQLKNLFYFGDTVAKSLIDHSGNGNDGVVYGNGFTVSDNYATFSGNGTSDGLNANRIIPAGTTNIAAIALVKKTGARGIFAALGASSGGGFAFGTERVMYKDSSAWVNGVFTFADGDGFYPMVWIVDSTGWKAMRLSATGGLATISQKSGGTFVPNDRNAMKIGCTGMNYAMDGSADIALAAFYEGEVSNEELINALLFCKLYGEKNGLTVL